MNTFANPFCFLIPNIFTITPNRRRKPSKNRSGGGPRFYHTRGRIGCKLRRQAKRSRHLAMLLIPWQRCTAFATTMSDQRSGTLQPFDSDSFQVKIDNCASKCITNCIDDFLTPPDPISINIIGVGGNIPCTHIGTVCWEIEDDDGLLHQLKIPGTIYAPAAPHRLLSPQHWSQTANDTYPSDNGTWCATYANHVQLHWSQCNFKRTVPLDPTTNTATLYTAAGFTAATALCKDLVSFTPAAYAHLIPAEEHELEEHPEGKDETDTTMEPDLRYSDTSDPSPPLEDLPGTPHEWLNLHFQDKPVMIEEESTYQAPSPQALWTYWHQRLGHISKVRMRSMASLGKLPRQLASCDAPLCPSCIAGKSTRKSWRTKGGPTKPSKTATSPGQYVYVDQLESPTPGFIGQMKSPKLTVHRYRVTTVFVDAFSDFTFIWHQTSTNAEQTLAAKHAFERFSASNNVSILHYHADNGRFAEPKFVDDVKLRGQTISFSGVGAHHQNGTAERRIRDLQDSARATLIHAHRRWPDAISVHLWPYALRNVADIRNATSNDSNKDIPLALFAGVERTPNLKDFHPFGCPVYVLDARMQSRQKLPKWEERTRVGINLCQSPSHAQSVSLVLNLLTGLVSPQFHVLHDDRFETVRDALVPKSKWQQLAGFPSPHPSATTKEPPQSAASEGDDAIPAPFLKSFTFNGRHQHSPTPEAPTQDTSASEGALPADEDFGQPPQDDLQPIRRSSRDRKPSRRLRESLETSAYGSLIPEHEAFESQVLLNMLEELDIDRVHPIAFAASSDPDTLYLHEAMRQPDAKQFEQAMAEEIKAHEDNDHWEIVDMDSVPPNTPILPAVWSMRRKRRIDTREVYKWKARLTIHGGKQTHGVNYWETFSPVVRWSTIRLTLILAIKYQWPTRQLDFVLAYPQAPVECDLYMQIPRGHKLFNERKRKAIKLKKNLYGQKQAGRVWNQYLTRTLTTNHFTQSTIDDCLFYFGDCIILIYVDDTIIAGPTLDRVNHVISVLSSLFNVEDQGDISDYLGVRVKQLPDGSFSLTQPHLIDSILKDLHFQPNTRPADTPALTTKILQPDADGKPFDQSWEYRSIIGKLNFLEKSTRPDIAYAVHQCARFSAAPKESHAHAVRRIGRYLLSTRELGLTYQPSEHSFHCWADADFVGNWEKSIAMEDVNTARSRSGYLITYAACPILWASKMQTEIALSTTEAEYIALSTALREVIPLMDLLSEFQTHIDSTIINLPTIHCRLFEDNSGAHELATTPKMRPRTKHINVKYHHFRAYVDRKLISLKQISSEHQLADIFTKPLNSALFHRLRNAIMHTTNTVTDQVDEGVSQS